MIQPWLLLLYLLFLSATSFSSCQPQNIETFFPFIETPSPAAAPAPTTPPIYPPTEPPLAEPLPEDPPQQPLPTPPSQSSSSSDRRNTIIKAVAATAASTLVFALLFFFGLQKYVIAKRKRDKVGNVNISNEGRPAGGGVSANEFSRSYESFKGVIVDENGLDVLYWRKLQNGGKKRSFKHKKQEEDDEEIINGGDQRKNSEAIQEVPLLIGTSSSSSSYHSIQPESNSSGKTIASTPPSPPPPPPPPPVPAKSSPAPPPPPPSIPAKTSTAAPPPPPPIPRKSSLATAPPPPKASGIATSLKPPSGAKKEKSSSENEGESSSDGQVKLKPLHWDKVNKNVNHSMVWDRIDGGSFSFDGDLMEALFGYVATNRKSSPKGNNNNNIHNNSENYPTTGPNSGQIIILDPQKSHNAAIVLKSLSISRKQITDALMEGNKNSLSAETLEKLVRITPTKEEQALILEFKGEPTKLADAESFHYHLLKSVPSAYTRLNALLFRSNYDLEIQSLKESLKTLELGCKELRTRGLFMKLLEAILKAGNRMNAGTSRGNAQAFDLTALRKLSDVKSSDGKTTLLHFVVEEVVRSEGKRCVLNRNNNLSRNNSTRNNLTSENPTSEGQQHEQLEKEYIKLGLPVVGGLSSQFSNVKKAAIIDYDTFNKTCSVLSANVAEIKQMLSECNYDRDGGGFAKEMKNFTESAEEEVKSLKEEQTKVMELVTRTTEYYQAGAAKRFKSQPLHLFVIIKDFLGMVDQVCVEITRNLQRRRTSTAAVGSPSSKSPAARVPVRFPILPANFMNDSRWRSSSCEDSDSES